VKSVLPVSGDIDTDLSTGESGGTEQFVCENNSLLSKREQVRVI
jgi:hypothetical protein